MNEKINYFSLDTIKDKFEQRSIFACIFTFFANLLVHIYMYTNQIFTYDACHIYDDSSGISSGRFMVPVIMSLFSRFQLPWLFGLIFSALMAISVVYVVKIMDIKKRISIILIALSSVTFLPIFTTNIFIGSLVVYGVALLSATLSVYFLTKPNIKSYMLALACIIISLGSYQAYISYAVSLFLIYLIRFSTGHTKEFKDTIKKFVIGTVLFLVAVGLYYLLWQLLLKVFPPESLSYYRNENNPAKGLISNLIPNILEAAKYGIAFCFFGCFFPKCFQLLSIFTQLAISFFSLYNLFKNKNILGILFFCGLPVSTFLICILNPCGFHNLMTFSVIVIFYLAIFFFDNWQPAKTIFASVVHKAFCIAIAITIAFSAVIGNAAYVQHHADVYKSVSITTRIVERIESYPGVATDSNVIFISSNDWSWYCATSDFDSGETHIPAKFVETRTWIKYTDGVASTASPNGVPYADALIWYIEDNANYVGLHYSFLHKADLPENIQDAAEELQSFPSQNCILRLDEDTVVFCL